MANPEIWRANQSLVCSLPRVSRTRRKPVHKPVPSVLTFGLSCSRIVLSSEVREGMKDVGGWQWDSEGSSGFVLKPATIFPARLKQFGVDGIYAECLII